MSVNRTNTIDPNNWSQVKQLLEELLEMAPDERLRFLAREDLAPDLKRELDSLLSFETEAEDMMQLSAVEFSHDLLGEDRQMIGQRFGPYQIISEIGHGGMGAVFLAERADGRFDQRVALKLLKREMNTAALRRRFRIEQEILARLEHPYIARLLDAGTTDDRIPFLVMEYVDGLPIDKFCARKELDLAARLELFRKVCSAVEFAHRNLVVHRDLKPSNVLVLPDGTPKLLDFGISKIISDEAADTATVTRLGVMTPGYASPEQLSNESVTTASDVYSLGVVLYELLSGRRPFEDREGNVKDVYSAVLESAPSLPSAASLLGEKEAKRREAAGEIQPGFSRTIPGRARITEAQRSRVRAQDLRGDLDNIVLKALRKEPERRYSSVENFSEDIQRYLEGMPVTARPDTFGYRTSKFLKRNRLGVLAAALVLVAVIAGLTATLWQFRTARIERAKAEQRFNDVRGIANSFLTEFSPLIERNPGSTPARKLLVTRALEYLQKLAAEAGDEPGLKHELAVAYERVGDVQGNPYNPNIGDVKGARDSYEKALALRQQLRGGDSEDLMTADDAALFEKLGGLHSNGGDYDKGKGFYDRALRLRERNFTADPASHANRLGLAKAVKARGLIDFFDGDNKAALTYYHRSREMYESLANERPNDDELKHELGYNYVSIGEALGWDMRPDEASEYLERGLQMLIPLADKYPADTSIRRTLNLSYNKRAENYEDLGKPDLAVEHFTAGLKIAKLNSLSDPDNAQSRRDVAMGYKKVAQALTMAKRMPEAIENIEFALAEFVKLREGDPNNPEAEYDVANTRFSLGETQREMGQCAKALGSFKTAGAEFDKVLADNPENIFAVRMSSYNLDSMGKCYVELKDLHAAVASFRQAFANFAGLRDTGKLGEVDLQALPDMQKNLEKLEARLAGG